MKDQLQFAKHHVEELNDVLKAEALALGSMMVYSNLDNNLMRDIMRTIIIIHTSFSSKLCSRISFTWRQHVLAQLHKGGGTMFKHIARIDKQFLNVDWSKNKGNHNSPQEFLKSQTHDWAKFWNPQDEGGQTMADTVVALRTHREAAFEFSQLESENQCPKHTLEELTKTTKSYKKTSLGSDFWSAQELSALPDSMKQSLVDVMNESLTRICVPHQNCLNLNPCLGKPSGDCRTICKSPMFYRMQMRMDTEIRKWELNNSGDYDAARIGGSALKAALDRNLRAEIAHWLDRHSAAVFNDFQNFFDTLDIPVLIKNALEVGFPPVKLAYILQQHLAPRAIQASSFTAQPVPICRSILAGCKASIGITRAYLKPGISQIHNKYPNANTSVLVDDTCMQSVGVDYEDVLEKIVPAVATFGDVARSLKLSLSPKAAITASTPKLALLLQKEMSGYNMTFKIDQKARDVGITHTAASSKPNKLVKNRFDNRKHKHSMTKRIASISRQARKLYSGSIFSSSTWGHQGSSLSENQMLQLERTALQCTGITEAGRCRAWGLFAAYGVLGSPRARIVRETVRSWFSIIHNIKPTQVKDLRDSWLAAKKQILGYGDKYIVGIMSNIISMLNKARWTPISFHTWLDHTGAAWSMTGHKAPPDQVANAIIKSFALGELERAESHYCGKGMGEGVHFGATLAYIRSLKPDQFANKALCENVLAAANWTAERIHSVANPDYPSVCPRCNCEPETPEHCYWSCPANANIEHEDVQSTQCLITKAMSDFPTEPCLWLRGILPDKYIKIPIENEPPDTYDITWVTVPTTINTGTFYGDASGGEFTAYPEIRRVGCSYIQIDHNDQESLAVHFPLPGPVQTVPRGELFTVVQLLRQCVPLADILFYTDNKWVFDTFNLGPKHACTHNNADLWHELYKITIDKAIKLNITWMPSHLEEGQMFGRPMFLNVMSKETC